MTDERLRDLYLAGLDARRAAGGPRGCDVEPERLLALARGEIPADERPALLDRVLASAACREELALLRAVVVAERGRLPVAAPADEADVAFTTADDADPRDRDDPAVVPIDRPRAAAPRPPRTWRAAGALAALAAALALTVGVPALLRDEAAPVMRGEADSVVLVAPPIAPVAPADARTFVWRPTPEAARYTFELLTADGALLHEAVTVDTTLALPATVTLTPDAEYRWLVRATDAGGEARGSAVGRLRVGSP